MRMITVMDRTGMLIFCQGISMKYCQSVALGQATLGRLLSTVMKKGDMR